LILSLIDEKPDMTLAELQARLAQKGIRAGLSTLWRFFKRRGITRKKDRACCRPGPARHSEAAPGLVRRPT